MQNIVRGGHDPLYIQIAHRIIAEIRKGKIPTGGMLPSISELMKQYPAGRVTVINALKKLVRDGFAVARHGKGFFATSMGEKNLVGVVLPIHSPTHIQIYSGLIAGIDNAAKKTGHRTLIMSSDEKPERFNEVVDEMIISRGVRWIIAIPPMNSKGLKYGINLKFLKKKVKNGIRMIIVDRRFPKEFPQLRQDRILGLSLLIDKAAGENVKSILVFLMEKNAKAMRILSERASEKGIGTVKFAIHKGAGKDVEMIKSMSANAVLCENDFHARDILDAIGGRPDFLIAGYGATPTATEILPRLTTVNPDFAGAGRMAFEYLAGKMACDGEVIYIKPNILEGSTL